MAPASTRSFACRGSSDDIGGAWLVTSCAPRCRLHQESFSGSCTARRAEKGAPRIPVSWERVYRTMSLQKVWWLKSRGLLFLFMRCRQGSTDLDLEDRLSSRFLSCAGSVKPPKKGNLSLGARLILGSYAISGLAANRGFLSRPLYMIAELWSPRKRARKRQTQQRQRRIWRSSRYPALLKLHRGYCTLASTRLLYDAESHCDGR